MKKTLAALALFCLSSSLFADPPYQLVVINKSANYKITAHIEICDKNYFCHHLIPIPIRNQPGQNTFLISNIPPNWTQFVNIIAAEATDSSGKVVAQSVYSFKQCAGIAGNSLTLDDEGTPYVVCTPGVMSH